TNVAFRTDDRLEPGELLSRAGDFFDERGRRFALWARRGLAEDEELIATAEARGFANVYEMPAMVLAGRAAEPTLADGVALRPLRSAEDAGHYWRIASEAYRDNGFPPEVFGHYEGLELLAAPDGEAAAFLADLDGEPAGI